MMKTSSFVSASLCFSLLALAACSSDTGATADAGAAPVDSGNPADAADASKPDAADSGVCPQLQGIYYDAPACGAAAVGKCSNVPPPCADKFCGCDGKTIIGCGIVGKPYAYKGECVADGGADATGD